jgi:hypothetical protein
MPDYELARAICADCHHYLWFDDSLGLESDEDCWVDCLEQQTHPYPDLWVGCLWQPKGGVSSSPKWPSNNPHAVRRET